MTTEDNDNDNGKEQEQQQSTVIKADKPSWLMVAGGSLLVALFVVGMVYARGIGNETTETSPVAAGMASSSPAAGDTTTKTTKTKNAPSDTLLTAILASGAALIIVGALYSRISTITLPGGVSIGLTTQETKTTKDAIDKELKDHPTSDRAAATLNAVDDVRQKKSRSGAIELSDDEVRRVAVAAAQKFKTPAT